MTRSELQEAINVINNADTWKLIVWGTPSFPYMLNRLTSACLLAREIILAEQKRSEGCKYCKIKECATCSCNRLCKGKIQNCECVDTDYSYEADYFCKFCGRDLTEGESV